MIFLWDPAFIAWFAQTLRRTNQSLCRSSLLFKRSSSFFQERPTRTFVSPRTFSSSKNSCKSRRGALSPNQHRWTAANGCSVAGSRKRSLPAGADMDSRCTARAATRDIVIFWRPIFFPFWKKNGGYTVEGLRRLISDTRIYRIQCTKYHRSPKVPWSPPKNLRPKRPCPWTSKAVLWIRNLFRWCRLRNNLSRSRSSQGSGLFAIKHVVDHIQTASGMSRNREFCLTWYSYTGLDSELYPDPK